MIKRFLVIITPVILVGSCGYYIQSEGDIDGKVLAMVAIVIVVALNIRKR